MKHLAIAAVILWAAFHFGGMFLSSDDRATDAALGRPIETPQRTIENPYRNGYFYLFGLTAAAKSFAWQAMHSLETLTRCASPVPTWHRVHSRNACTPRSGKLVLAWRRTASVRSSIQRVG